MNGRNVIGSMCFLYAIVLVAPSARGAVFERDWKTPGDGLLTYDDVNRRVWLDLPFTIEMFPVELRIPSPAIRALRASSELESCLKDL